MNLLWACSSIPSSLICFPLGFILLFYEIMKVIPHLVAAWFEAEQVPILISKGY